MMSFKQRDRMCRRALKRDPRAPRTHTGQLLGRIVAIPGGRPVFTADYCAVDSGTGCVKMLPHPLYQHQRLRIDSPS
jgi:hypothetical protein